MRWRLAVRRASPKGGKWWRLKYRHLGKEKRLSLGVYPAVTLKEARERRDAARKQLAGGVDPSAHRQATKTATVEGAMTVSGNWRITFRFVGENATDFNLEDFH